MTTLRAIPASHDSPRQAATGALQLVFAGGCHIYGYLVGARHSFAALAQSSLESEGIRCAVQTVAPLPLSHPERIAERLLCFRADALILQVGHWETVVGMRNYLRFLAGVKLKPFPNAPPSDDGVDLHLRPTPGWRLRMLTKRMLDGAFGHRVIDLAPVGARLTSFLDAVATLGTPRVVVLSPFPCADPVVLHYRSKLAAEMRQASADRGFDYIDVLAGPRLFPRAGFSPYADPIHLSREGHRVIAGILVQHLLSVLNLPGCVSPGVRNSTGSALS